LREANRVPAREKNLRKKKWCADEGVLLLSYRNKKVPDHLGKK
jgi:hypothetical protein